MDGMIKGMLLVLLVLYLASPVDLAPGPIDDILLLLFVFASGKEGE